MEKRFIVERSPKNGSGDVFQDVFCTLEEANQKADYHWHHLTHRERKMWRVVVLVVTEKDLDDYATDQDTGDVDWRCYFQANYPDGGFDSNKIGDETC